MSESADARPDARSNSRTDARPSDPTYLTTQALLREISSLRELVEARLDGMDKAQKLFDDNLTRMPTDTDKQISHLKELHAERFAGVQKQFEERDTRTEQTSRDSKVAVDAALQAAKEAVGEQNRSSALAIAKSEAATTKQIDGLVVLIQTATGAIDGKISDLKDRLTTIEGKSTGQGQTWGVMVAALGALLGIVGLIWGMTH